MLRRLKCWLFGHKRVPVGPVPVVFTGDPRLTVLVKNDYDICCDQCARCGALFPDFGTLASVYDYTIHTDVTGEGTPNA